MIPPDSLLRDADQFQIPMTGIVGTMGRLVILLAAISTIASTPAKTALAQKSATTPAWTYTAEDVSHALDKAEEYKREGKYAQALERQIWFHKNALKYAPAMRGVRLSFALGVWIELGQVICRA